MRGPFFLVILFVIAVALRIDFFFTIFYLFALVYALSHVWMQGTARRLSVRRRFDNHAFCGDEVKVDLHVRNSGLLPIPWLEAHESLPVQLRTPPFYRQVFSLRAHADRRLSYSLLCQRRGYYPIGPLTVRAGDLLGLVRPRTERAEAAHLIVYPRILSLDRLGLPTRSPLVALPARSPLFEDPARVMGVREYQRGDSPRRIHWTASARATAVAQAEGMRLMVKRYQPAIARETLICLDLYQQDYGQRQRYTATELAIVVAASLANHIIVREGLPVGLLTEARDPLIEAGDRGAGLLQGDGGVAASTRSTIETATRTSTGASANPGGAVPSPTWSGWTGNVRPATHSYARVVRLSLPPRSGRGHLMSVLEVLARVQTLPAAGMASGALGPFVDLLRQGAAGLSWGATVAIVTGRESAELFDALLYLRRTGFAVTLILVQPGLPSPDLKGGADRLNVPVYRVWQERDLETMVAPPTLVGPHSDARASGAAKAASARVGNANAF